MREENIIKRSIETELQYIIPHLCDECEYQPGITGCTGWLETDVRAESSMQWDHSI